MATIRSYLRFSYRQHLHFKYKYARVRTQLKNNINIYCQVTVVIDLNRVLSNIKY